MVGGPGEDQRAGRPLEVLRLGRGRPRRTLRVAPLATIGAALATLALVGCSPEPAPEPPASSTTSSASDAPTTDGSDLPPEPSASATEDLDGDASHEPLSAPTWDEAARVDVQAAATAAVAAWARPDLDYDAWWSGLSPMLSESARQTFGAINPAFIPATTVTGDVVLEDDGSHWLATLLVPTDGGDVRVLMLRDGAGAPWLMERIDPA